MRSSLGANPALTIQSRTIRRAFAGPLGARPMVTARFLDARRLEEEAGRSRHGP
jgi:hypothetical protein